MKKKILLITIIIIYISTFIPFVTAANTISILSPAPDNQLAGDFTATLFSQMEITVSDVIGEWELGNIPEASVEFKLFEPVTISLEFEEPVKFTGHWANIQTNVPVVGDFEALMIGGKILSFIVDGEDLGSRPVKIIDRDRDGSLTLDLTQWWDGGYDPYGLVMMEPFLSIDITFVIGHIANLMGHLDTSVNSDIPELGLGNEPGAIVPLKVGQLNTIKMEFTDPIKLTGEWLSIVTSLPVINEEDAESTGAFITSFIVDNKELGSKIVPLIDFDGFMAIDIANQQDDSFLVYDEYGLADMEPFTTLEITFLVPSMPEGEDLSEPRPVEVPTHGKAWIAGTVLFSGRTDDLDPGLVDWYEFKDQSVEFEVGTVFTVTLDLGSETATHDDAFWEGYILCVETDIDFSETYFEAFIGKIVLDGRQLRFNADNVEINKVRGIRVPLTSSWSDTPLAEYSDIGTFSKLEITLVLAERGKLENPFAGLYEPDDVTTPPPGHVPNNTPEPLPPPEGRLPGWVIPVTIIGVAIVAIITVFIVITTKK